ncbi:hypothetical protein Srot_1674 [Segniliparus rotundus DSM 44985]|uniref:Aminoglycoside phosphotransferase n=1 Tax=Segniliparus rotundus (strain ATCC BAA-972 / CDC 1076 / CIP 108378 / DSM 44985 / JCM 13578) TaxID=640132 RepID=D6Z855_SEGRD|nr:hypothetical protein [Segniliparus rotundus]ADG98135.1 hypothetical protein Srot_1674 [Segniliparus rotundus DSM 44985]
MTSSAVEPEPSPSWIACGARWTRAGGSALRRAHDPADEVFASPLPAILAAWTAAADEGIAPAVTDSDETGFTTALIAHARPAKLDDLADENLLRAALGLRARFHELDVELPERSLFDDVARLRDAHRAASIPVPAQADELSDTLERFAARHERFAMQSRPCHGNGAVSNLLLRRSGGPMLTGWSLVARRDPVQEAGSVIAELNPWRTSSPAVLEALRLPAEADMAARAWSVADDLLWVLIAHWRMATAPDKDVDYVKYGLWRGVLALAATRGCSDLAAWLQDPR